MASLSRLEAPFLDITSYALNDYCSFKINVVLVDKDAHQRETISKLYLTSLRYYPRQKKRVVNDSILRDAREVTAQVVLRLRREQ